jgi:hypothetical protein
LLDHAGLMTQLGLCPIQVHDLPGCRLLFETAPVLRKGDLLFNWLQVLGTAERSQVDQSIRHQLHAIVSLLEAFKAE